MNKIWLYISRLMSAAYLPISFLKSLCVMGFAPIKTLWGRDKTYILIFIVVNLIIGQLGVLISLALSLKAVAGIQNAITNNLITGAFYIFSISLVVSSLAVIGSELIDAIRNKETVRFFDTKVVWVIFGLAAVVLQGPMAGSLLSESSYIKNYSSINQPDPTIKAPSVNVEAETNNNYLQPVTTKDGTHPPATNTSKSIDFIQLTFWLFSMLIAFELYCLHRIPLITDLYSAHRKEEIQELIKKAEQQTSTPFGEAV